MDKTYRCALYARLSKEDGDKAESDSIANQKDLIRDFLKSCPDIELVSERVDDGWSGASFERPQFQAMMVDIRAGLVDCVCVKDLSRFGRNFTETGKYLEQIFPFLGIRFLSVNDRLDSNAEKSAGDRILIPFVNLVNDAYCRDISIKIRSQLEIKRKKGDFIGSFAVYGYLKDSACRNRIVVDDFAADIVRGIFRWKIEGMSAAGIAGRLNAAGVLSPLEYKRSLGLKFTTKFQVNEKALWTATAVGRVLCDEIYTGVMAQGKRSAPNHKVKKLIAKPKDAWIRAYDTHEAIISKEDFGLVAELLLCDTRIAPSEETVYVFSGIIHCGDCGENMIRKTVPANGKKYHYYICKGSKSKTCSPHSVSEKLLTEGVAAALRAHIDNILNLEQVLAYIGTLPLKQEEVRRIDRQLLKLSDEIKRYKDLKLSLYESLMSGLISEDDYKQLRDAYSRKSDDAEAASLRLRGEIERLVNGNGEKNFWIEYFKKRRNFAELTRAVVVSLIERIDVYEGGRIDIKFRYQYNYDSAVSFAQAVDDIRPLEVSGRAAM
jgi:DNA invertase Pin-like site-specific DNA recombinase